MNHHPFLQFINLVAFDQKFKFVENEKIAVELEVSAIKKQEEEVARVIDEMRQNVFQLKKQVDEQELEMKVLDQKEKEKKQRLENLSDYKEYQAIRLEIELIQRMQVNQEQVVLDSWNRLEGAQLSLQKKIVESNERIKQLQSRVQELEKKIIMLNSDIAEMKKLREEKKIGVPAEWLEKYMMMQARVKDPVVEIVHQSCGACSQMITSQEMVRVKHGALVQCQKCYRLLYSSEIMKKNAS
ncbi:MAG TPA: hypothetical protein VLB80_02880 [Candidatus Babeliales bacterium]|nr:hypothetical protein [Candidatus Babeliales bacterium]